jgi:uncharacterized membrane protein
LRVLQAALLVTAGLGAGLLVLIALNLARFGEIRLVRFREATLAVEIALLAAMLAGRDPSSRLDRWRARVEQWIADERFYRAMLGAMLVLFVIAALTQHWAFRTGSHDFSMIDEALYWSHHGHFLYSPVLGRSFLSEHFAPILMALVPLHALVPSPYLLVLIQPLALWASGPVLGAILRREGVAPAPRHLALLVYLNHAVMVSTLGYLFHMECFLPLALFTLFLMARRRSWLGYGLALLFALSIKEDVGFYVAGFGLWIAIAEKRWRLGLFTAAASLAWSLAAIQLAIPVFAVHDGGYAFLGRWNHWGHGIGGALLGMASRPLDVAAALFAKPFLGCFASLLFLPFASRFGFVLVLAPWVLNATSALAPQRMLSLYYGIPLLACAALASVAALRDLRPRRIATGRMAFALAALAVMANVSNLSFPAIPRERAAIVRSIAAIPDSIDCQLQGCFFPVAGYAREKFLLRPGEPLTKARVILWTRGPTWPFSRAEVDSLARSAIASGRYRNVGKTPGFYLLERIGASRE